MVHDGSDVVQVGSSVVHDEPERFRPPQWYEFEAATPVNQRFKGLRVAGFICCAGGAVVVIYMSRPPTEQAFALLGCVLYVLAFDPFIAVGSILARASRIILASAVCMIGIAIMIPSPGIICGSVMWTFTAFAAVKRFNRRYLMQDTFASARAIPDAIRTAPESKAGLAWRRGGAKTVNAMAAEIGATCRDHAEVRARELSFYIGYQTADTKMTELARRCDRLRIENMALKDAEAEKSELLQTLDEVEAEHKKRLKTANTERQRLLKKVQELEDANAELMKAIPKEPEPEIKNADDVDSKLEHAFLVMHMTDRDAAEFAGCDKSRAWRYRKDKGIKPKGG